MKKYNKENQEKIAVRNQESKEQNNIDKSHETTVICKQT